MPTSEPQGENEGEARSGTLQGGHDPAELGRRSGEARRAKARQREDRAEENALTFRQRLGVSLSKLTQAELDKRVKDARPSELVRFADQAFGRPMQAEEDAPKDAELAELTREQRAAYRQWLLSEEGTQQGQDSAQDGTNDPTEH